MLKEAFLPFDVNDYAWNFEILTKWFEVFGTSQDIFIKTYLK